MEPVNKTQIHFTNEVPLWHEEYQLNETKWNEIVEKYGPFNIEGCARDDGQNARLDNHFTPSRPFHHWVPTEGDRVFLNPPFSNAQEYMDIAKDHTHGIRDVTVLALIPHWPSQFNFDGWEKLESYSYGSILFQHPNGDAAGPTRWNTLLLRLKTT